MIGTMATSAALAQPSSPSGLNVYPSFHLKFERGGGTYLLASTIIVNVSDKTVRDLTLQQTYPRDLVPTTAPSGIHEYFARPEGFQESVEGQVYTMTTPLLRRGEMTSALALLRYDGRPSTAVIPPAQIKYSAAGESFTEGGPALTLDLNKYTKYSGTLTEYIRRYAGIVLEFPGGDGPDWGFSGFASSVRAKTPIGMVETEGDAAEGRFSLIRGEPGDTRLLLVAWKPEPNAGLAESRAQVLDVVRRQIMPSAAFELDMEGATVEKGRLGRYEAWVIGSRWTDKVVDRLGEGPARWYLYDDTTRKRRYLVLIAAQGRGAGPGKAGTPNLEKEASLMKELEQIAGSFRAL